MIISQEIWRTRFSNIREKYIKNNKNGGKNNDSSKKRRITKNN